MERNAEKELETWKTGNRRKPLLIRGARQVGKSWLVEHWGKSAFNSFLKVDLEKNPELKRIFKPDRDVRRICRELELFFQIRIIPGDALVFFDEVQGCPDAITTLRYFFEDLPELHIIAAGSLIEFTLKEVSFPVGRVQVMDMFPMSFSEFLLSRGVTESLKELAKQPAVLSPPVHDMLISELRNYFRVGGMPEAVGVFNDSDSFMDAFDVQKDIIQTYQMDFAKYAGHADIDCLREVLPSVAQQVGQQVKYSSLSTRFSHTTVTKAYRLLETARLIKSVRSVNPSGLPLGASFLNKRFKPLFVDIGLMQNICGVSRQVDFESTQLLDIYRGALAEQFVGQEQLCFLKNGPWYWSNSKKSSTAEVDYCFEQNGAIVPIEVKSGTGGHLKSLTQFLSKFTTDRYGIVFSSRPYARDDTYRIEYLPFYYTGTVFGEQR